MAGQVKYFRDLGVKFGTMWGFDSFIGLPPEKEGHMLLTKNWKQGAYSAADALRTWRWDRVEKTLRNRINRSEDEGEVVFIRGFFNGQLLRITTTH